MTSPLWGSLTDRIGPVKVLLIAGVSDAGALAFWALIHSPLDAVIGGPLLAVFGGAGWGPACTLLVRLVPSDHRPHAYGFNFMLVNLGTGCGGLVSAAVVDLHHPLTFRRLHLGNAAVSFAAGAFLVTSGITLTSIATWRQFRMNALRAGGVR